MAENTLLKYFFSSGAEVDPEGRFNLSRKTRMRRLREIYRLHEGAFRRGYDLVVVARGRAVDAQYRQLEEAYLALAAKLELLQEAEDA